MRYRRVAYSYSETLGAHHPCEAWMLRPVLGLGTPAWQPPTDFFETEEAFVGCIELAGISEDDVAVTLFDDRLVLEGVRMLHRDTSPARFFTAEVRGGPFRVELPVPPDVKREAIDVACDRGFIVVRMPRCGAT